MTSRFYGLRSALVTVALLAACKEDPTASLTGGATGVELEFDYLEVNIDDSARVDGVVRDAVGNPLDVQASVTACSSQDVTIVPASAAPLLRTRFYVKALRFFTSCRVIATVGSLADTVDVSSFPASLEVSGPTTLVSGTSATYTHRYRSASGRDITAQIAAPTWSTSSSSIGPIVAATGVATARDFGTFTVTATGPGSAAGGTVGRTSVLVTPAAFGGAFTAGEPSDTFTITAAAGQTFDSDIRVFLNRFVLDTVGGATFERVLSIAPTAIRVRLDDLRAVGKYELVLTRVGASQVAMCVPLGTGCDSVTVAAPALAGAITTPVEPGARVTINAGTGPAFDNGTRVYFNGVRQTLVDSSASALTVAIPDLAGAGARSVLITRLGSSENARSGTFTVSAPTPLGGVAAPTSGRPAEIITVTRAASDPAFDNDVRAFINGNRTFIADSTADAIKVVVFPLGTNGPAELLMTRIGAAQAARTLEFTTLTASPNIFNDPSDAVNNDPSTSPVIAANGDQFIILHGACHNGAGGADCDDFFTITNGLARPDTITVRAEWLNAADVDILWCLRVCLDFSDLVGNFAGATTANPEVSTVIIPANTTWRLWLNLFDPLGTANALTRVRVSGKG